MRSIQWTGTILRVAVLIVMAYSASTMLAGPPENPLRQGFSARRPGTPMMPGSPLIVGELVDIQEIQQAGYGTSTNPGSALRLSGYTAPIVSKSVLQNPGEGVEVLPDGGAGPEAEGIVGDTIIVEGETIIDGHCESCGHLTLGLCKDGCLIPCPQIQWEKFQFFGGAAGFTSPANRGGHGSFGFTEGFNWGTGFPNYPRISGQIGYRAIQSSFSGTDFTDLDRKQSFVTAGLFRRADWGWQGGVVMDYMHDDWVYDLDVIQVRGELSWKYPDGHELGFWFTGSSRDSTSTALIGKTNPVEQVETWELTNLYAFYYRTQLEAGGESRLFGGFTGDRDGLIGADIRLPINGRWALDAGFTYLVPEESSQTTGYVEEGWNVSVGLVFFPGWNSPQTIDYNRPLFNVADNGTMFLSPR